MDLPIVYYTIPKPVKQYKKSQGLAETLVRRELKRRGYIVTRGTLLDTFFEQTLFDESDSAVFVRWKLTQMLGIKRLIRIAKYCTKNHGTPDFLAAHPAQGVIAVEVKLHHESIKKHQLQTMQFLQHQEVVCVVWRVVPNTNKVREKKIALTEFFETKNLRQSTKKVAYEKKLTTYAAKTK